VFNYNKTVYFYIAQLLIVILLGLYLIFYSQWTLQSNLLSLLPNSSQQQNFTHAEQALFSEKQKQITILTSGKNSVQAHQLLQQKIQSIDEITLVESSHPSISNLTAFYSPYKHNLLSTQYSDSLNSAEKLAQLVTAQLSHFSNPFVSETLSVAPRLNLAHYLQESLDNMGNIEYYNDISAINVNQQYYLITQLQLNIDGFSLKHAQTLTTQLTTLFKEITQQTHAELIYSGIIFHTAESTTQAQNEMLTFGIASIIAVIIIVSLTFRSLLPIITAVAVISIASFYGITAILLFFNELHALTLVFAITLIGIVIDYCFHFFVYAANNTNTSSKITKPLTLGFITTALGYSALMFSPLTLLSQVALFMIFGLLGALFTVIAFLPNIKQLQSVALSRKASQLSCFFLAFIQQAKKQRNTCYLLFIACITLLFFYRPIAFNDNVKLLNSSPSWLLLNEQKMADIFQYTNSTQVIVKAKSIQQLLERQELVIKNIHNKQPNLSIKSITNFLPSIKHQKQQFERLQQADNSGLFTQALSVTGLQDPITNFIPLTYSDFVQGPLFSLSQHYIAEYTYLTPQQIEQKEYALFIEISGKPLIETTLQWLKNTDNVTVFNKAEDASKALSLYRQDIVWLLLIATAIVTIVLISSYGIKSGIFATISTVGSSLIALLLSQYIVGELNIFNLLAVLLILALAIDYVIFYQEHGATTTTFIAISLSAISSALVFGILIFSKTPAVNYFGLTVMIGIVAIYVLAPLSSINQHGQTNEY